MNELKQTVKTKTSRSYKCGPVRQSSSTEREREREHMYGTTYWYSNMQVQTSTSETRPRAAHNTASPRLKTVRKRAKALRPKRSSFHRRARARYSFCSDRSVETMFCEVECCANGGLARGETWKAGKTRERASGGKYVGNTKATKKKKKKKKKNPK